MRAVFVWRPLLGGAALMCAGALVGCDLSDVVVSEGESTVVVHGVLRPDLPEQFFGRQFIVVEHALTGTLDSDAAEGSDDPRSRQAGTIPYVAQDTTEDGRFHAADSLTIPYGGYPPIPIEGVTVLVANLDFPEDPCGSSVQFVEDPGSPVKSAMPGLYWSPQDCPTLRAGDRLALIVETQQGDTITGVTRIPAMESAYLQVAGDSVLLGGDEVTQFNRDRDTLRIEIEAEAGRLLQFEVRRSGDLTDFGTKIYVDTTAFAVPASVINTFVIGDEDDVFRAGRDYIISVALTDSNYFDFSRSRNNTFTGRGFINRLSGGIGVFGSLVALSTNGRVIGEQEDPREGTYSLLGTFAGDTQVEMTLDLYLARSTDTTEFSAFAEGQAFFGEIDRSIDGLFAGDEFTAILVQDVGGTVRADTLRGIRQEGEPWQVIAYSLCGRGGDGEFRPCSERTIVFRGTMEQR